MGRRRSALFLDFDNIFGGLLELDRDAALVLATEPLVLVDQLATCGLEASVHRDLLVRRAYLNPHGSVYYEELGNENKRLYLQKFRPNLTRAGFEVIDCPAPTSAQKNAADIRIVIDVLTLLEQSTHLDEILIASSDADFTPLLQRVRAQDRRTAIIRAGPAGPAYRAVADLYLDEEALIGLLRRDTESAIANESASEQFAQLDGPELAISRSDSSSRRLARLMGQSSSRMSVRSSTARLALM